MIHESSITEFYGLILDVERSPSYFSSTEHIVGWHCGALVSTVTPHSNKVLGINLYKLASSGSTGFLPLSKDVQIRSTGVNVYSSFCDSPVIDGQPGRVYLTSRLKSARTVSIFITTLNAYMV